MAIQNNFPNIRPTLNLNFALSKRVDPRITFVRSTTATYFDQDGVLQSAANNQGRITFDPSTLDCQGLLIEEQRTNSIRNNTMQGAVAGTPGTAPTNWSITGTANGITRQIVGTGTENGITYIDVRYSGTATAAGFALVRPESITQIAAASGQSWTSTFYWRVAAGATSNISALEHWVIGADAGGATTESTQATPTISSAFSRPIVSRTLNNALTAFVYSYIAFTYAINAVIDITLRIGLPQLEQGAFATSVIPTTTTALTRNADVASMTGTNFSSWYNQTEGTLYVEGVGVNNVGAGTRRYAEINDNTPSERILVGYGFTTACRYLVSDGGATQADIGVNATTGGALVKAAATYKVNDFQQATNGVLGTADTSGTLPTVDRMFIGQAETTAAATMLNGTIRRIAYYPVRATNAQLQALTG